MIGNSHRREDDVIPICALLVALSFNQAPTADQPGRIAGRVTVAGSGLPVAEARVILIPTQRPAVPGGMPPQAMTDRDGRYEFAGVAPGGYRVDVQKTGFAPLTAIGPGQPPAVIVRVGPGQSVDGVDRQLQKGGVISGQILDPNGEPLPDASIMVMRRLPMPGRGGAPAPLMPAPGQSRQTDDRGDYRVAGLAPGEYYVAAMPRPAMLGGGGANGPRPAPSRKTTIARTFYPGTLDEAAAQPVVVAAGAEIGNITFTMQSAAAFRISGTVVDESGAPVANAMVMVSGDPRSGSMGPVGNARTRDNGRFEIDDVPPGTYRAHASIMNIVAPLGGVSGGSGVSMSISAGPGTAIPPDTIVVTDADVTGVRVVARRPNPQ